MAGTSNVVFASGVRGRRRGAVPRCWNCHNT